MIWAMESRSNLPQPPLVQATDCVEKVDDMLNPNT